MPAVPPAPAEYNETAPLPSCVGRESPLIRSFGVIGASDHLQCDSDDAMALDPTEDRDAKEMFVCSYV